MIPKNNPESNYSSTTLQLLAIFRLILALMLSAFYLISQKLWPLDEILSHYFLVLLFSYLLFILISILLLKYPILEQITMIRIFAVVDLILLSTLCFFTDGLESPLIILILISIMVHGAFLLMWQSLLLVLIAIAIQIYFWTWDVQFESFASLHDYFGDQRLTRVITQGLFTGFAVVLCNMWLRRYEASDKIILQQEAELKQAALLHETIIQQFSNGIIVLDHDSKIILINEYIRIWFGGEININMKLQDYLPDLYYRYLLWLDFAFLEKKPFKINDEEFYSDFQEIKQQDINYTLISIERPETINLRAQQNKLAALGQLTAAIAHEIRNPMTSIFQAAHLLKEQDKLNPTQIRLIDIINNNINRANKIINEVLILAKRDNPNMDFLHITEKLESLLDEFKLSYPKYAHCVEIILDDNFTTVYFDADHLKQILWNLMVNATRHSKLEAEELKIILRGEIISQNPTLTIIDNGVGISKEDQKSIFNPFYTTDNKSGIGLGLFLVKEMCEINHSHIDYLPNISDNKHGFRIIFSRHL